MSAVRFNPIKVFLFFTFLTRRLTKTSLLQKSLMICLLITISTHAFANNPLVSHIFTADPAARVFNNKVYIITSHDQDDAVNYDGLVDYLLFSSDDMVNWQDHGIVFAAKANTTWASKAFAPDFIQRNGKYYLIFPDGADSIGILVADQPEGPYTDLIGKPLIDRNTPNADVQWLFDPGVLLDDDNTVYVYFGGGGPGNARVIKLNDSLTETVGPAITIDAPNFFEAPYVHKKDGTYYFSYSTNETKGFTIDYMTSKNPMAGFTHVGTVIDNPWKNLGNNNHQSFIEFNKQWYAFYHNRAVSNTVYQRSINVDLLAYNSDGSLQKVIIGTSSVPQIKSFNPYRQVEAETMDQQSGIKTEKAPNGTISVKFDNNDWIKISKVDFANGAGLFEARIAANSNTSIDIILDDLKNSPTASLQVKNTGGLQTWSTQETTLKNVDGVHDVYLKANGQVNIDWYQYKSEPAKAPSGGAINYLGFLLLLIFLKRPKKQL